MKRFLVIFSFVMFLVLAISNYFTYQTEAYRELIDSSKEYIYDFKIPEDILNADPKRLSLLKKAARKNKVNVIRSISYYDNKKEQTQTEAYLLLTTDTRLFDKINITKGRSLTIEDMQFSKRYISTEGTSSQNKMGSIGNFGENGTYSIHVLDNLISNYKYPGNYKIEASSEKQYNNFITDYVNFIYDDTGEKFSPKMYQDVTSPNQIKVDNTIDTSILALFFITIMILTFLFHLVMRTKEISVMRLNGRSMNTICLEIFIRFFTKVFLLSNVILIPWMLLIKNNNFDFITKVYITNLIIYILLTFISASLCYLYSKHIRIVSSIKGKKPIRIISFLNGLFKVVVSILLLISAVNLFATLNQVNQKQSSLDQWSDFYNYGVFYPIKSGNDTDAIREGKYPLDIPTYNLYPYLNQQFEAIYIDSDLYTEESLELNAGKNNIIYITVNPNYLKKYPILDKSGNEIEIDEKTEHSIYLVPEQYQEKEDFNLDFFSEARRDSYELHHDFYGRSDKSNSKEIKFIYTKENQEIFSMNPDVMPNHDNMIIDPIVQVVTEENAMVPDIHYTSTSNQTLFIELTKSDTELTYSKLLSKLQEYELDDNFPYLVQTNEVILEEINDLNNEVKAISYILLFMFGLFIMLLFQNIYLQFERNKYEFFLKKSLGKTFTEKYKKILYLLLLTNLIEYIAMLLLIDNQFFALFIGKLLIEVVLISLLIIYFERKNTIQILKEGV